MNSKRISKKEFRHSENGKHSPYLESDEAAWIFAGYYFNLYFLRFDLLHPDWNDYEAVDQPPLAKYIVGGSLHLKGYTVDSLYMKRLWNNVPVDKLHIFFVSIKHKIPSPAIVIPNLFEEMVSKRSLGLLKTIISLLSKWHIFRKKELRE